MIDWNVIGIIAIIGLYCGVHFSIIKYLNKDVSGLDDFGMTILFSILAMAIELVIFCFAAAAWPGIIYLFNWGVGNIVLSFLSLAVGLALPVVLGRGLVFKIPLALYYFTRKQIVDFRQDAKQYKAKLEKEYPIKQVEPGHWR